MKQQWLRMLGLTVLDDDQNPRAIRESEELVNRVIWNWPQDEPIRLERAIERHPELEHVPRALIEIAVEEFADRRRNGESITAVRFAGRFPEIQTRLLDSIIVDQEIADHSEWFADVLTRRKSEVNWPLVGETVAGFQLLEVIGSGGFSQVYLAEDPDYPDRRVALKVCQSETHEATTLANLHHSAIGVVYSVRQDEERNLTAISMAYRSRTTLYAVARRLWKNGRPGRTESAERVWDEVQTANEIESAVPEWAAASFHDWVLDLAIELSRGLAASHELNTVHCDIKPSNILIDRNGKPILVDFNVAFQKDATKSPANVGGTLPYMAPEQIRALAGQGYADITDRTDLYSLGATLYELLTGEPPFGRVTSAQDGIRPLLEMRVPPVVSMRKVAAHLDPEFDQLIRSCLSYEIDHRPVSAEVLADQLERIRKRRLAKEIARPRRKLRRGVLAASAILVCAAVAVGGVLMQQTTPESGIVAPLNDAECTRLVEAGYDLLQEGNLEAAGQHFDACLVYSDEHFGATLGRSRVDLATNMRTPRMNRVLKLAGNPIPPAVQAYHAYEQILRSEFRTAIQLMKLASQKGFDTYALRLNLGYCYYQDADYEQAVQSLKQASQLYPQGQEARLMLILADLSRDADSGAPINVGQVHDRFAACDASGERHLTEAMACCFVARIRFTRNKDREEWAEWSRAAVTALDSAIEQGPHESNWFRISPSLENSVRANEQLRFKGLAKPAAADTTDYRLYTMNPLIETDLNRCLARSISSPGQQRESKASRLFVHSSK